jgi:hypothetical protein
MNLDAVDLKIVVSMFVEQFAGNKPGSAAAEEGRPLFFLEL